jgi:hypothetical protein
MLRLKTYVVVAVALAVWLGVSNLARAEDFPKGKYSATIQDMKITIKFEDKGKFTVEFGDEVMVEGNYKVNKDVIEFSDNKGKAVSKEDEKKVGKYKWKVDDKKKLTFTKIEDEVEGRVMGLTAGPWTKE